MKYEDLKQQTILITGGATGIGAAMVRSFAKEGAYVFFCDIQETAGRELSQELGENTFFSKVDLAVESETRQWIQQSGQQFGSIKVLINNVANDKRIAFKDLQMEEWDRLIQINLKAAFICIQEAIPFMEDIKGSVINFGSVTFHLGPPNMSSYVSAKGGINGLTRSLARELGPQKIRVNTISPGWIMTERQQRDHVTEEIKELLYQQQCISDLIQPQEIAEVALFLASEASSAITGQNIMADRGWVHH